MSGDSAYWSGFSRLLKDDSLTFVDQLIMVSGRDVGLVPDVPPTDYFLDVCGCGRLHVGLVGLIQSRSSLPSHLSSSGR